MFRSRPLLGLLLGFTCLALAAPVHAQGVAINGSGAPADTSAILDLTSTAKGFLPPRMTAAQRAAIFLPATGLVVWQTDGTAGLYANTGAPGAPGWQLVGAGATPGQWSVNGSDLYYGSGNVGIGAAPVNRLDVRGLGNWDVVNTEGDVRIGNGSYRLKFGVALGGGGAGSANIMQFGQPGGYNVLSLGAQGNYIMNLVGNTGFVGIGMSTPDAPLAFPPVLGRKITLYPGATGDVGFAVAGNRLQIYADNPNADVAVGYDAAGTFNERFAFKPNGALAVNGNTGTAGQVLQSNGSGTAASWVSPTAGQYNDTYSSSFAGTTLHTQSDGWVPSGLSVTFTSTALFPRATVTWTLPIYVGPCSFCSGTQFRVKLVVDGVDDVPLPVKVGNGDQQTLSGTRLVSMQDTSNHQHTIQLYVMGTGDDYYVSYNFYAQIIAQVIHQ